MIRAAGPVLAVLLLGGCGVRPTGTVYAGDAPTATAAASPEARVFFLSKKTLVPVSRPVKPGDVQAVFDALVAGPTPDERKKGLGTAIKGVKALVVQELGGRALLIDTAPPRAGLSSLAYAQIYCTGTLLPDRPIMKIAYANGGTDAYPPFGCGDPGGTPIPYPRSGKPPPATPGG